MSSWDRRQRIERRCTFLAGVVIIGGMAVLWHLWLESALGYQDPLYDQTTLTTPHDLRSEIASWLVTIMVSGAIFGVFGHSIIEFAGEWLSNKYQGYRPHAQASIDTPGSDRSPDA